MGRAVDDVVAPRGIFKQRAVRLINVAKAKHRDHGSHHALLLAIVLVRHHAQSVVLKELLGVVDAEVAARLVNPAVDPLALAVVRRKHLYEVQDEVTHFKDAREDNVRKDEVARKLLGSCRVEDDHIGLCWKEDTIALRDELFHVCGQLSLKIGILLLNVDVLDCAQHSQINVHVELARLTPLNDLVEQALVLALDLAVELNHWNEAANYVGTKVAGEHRHVVADRVNGLHCHRLRSTAVTAFVKLVHCPIPVGGKARNKSHSFFLNDCRWRNIYYKDIDKKCLNILNAFNFQWTENF